MKNVRCVWFSSFAVASFLFLAVVTTALMSDGGLRRWEGCPLPRAHRMATMQVCAGCVDLGGSGWVQRARWVAMLCSLPTACCSLPDAFCSLPSTFRSLLAAPYSLLHIDAHTTPVDVIRAPKDTITVRSPLLRAPPPSNSNNTKHHATKAKDDHHPGTPMRASVPFYRPATPRSVGNRASLEDLCGPHDHPFQQLDYCHQIGIYPTEV